MKNKSSGILFVVVGLCFAVIFNGQILGILAGVLFIIAGIAQILVNRKTKQ